jgi:hypothetical protein
MRRERRGDSGREIEEDEIFRNHELLLEMMSKEDLRRCCGANIKGREVVIRMVTKGSSKRLNGVIESDEKSVKGQRCGRLTIKMRMRR